MRQIENNVPNFNLQKSLARFCCSQHKQCTSIMCLSVLRFLPKENLCTVVNLVNA